MIIGDIVINKKSNSVKLYFKNDSTPQGYYKTQLNKDLTTILYNELARITDKQIIHDDKCYYGEISTYSKEVERILTVRGTSGNLKIDLICYTDDDEDDNWITFSHKNMAQLAGMIYPYI